MAQTLPNHTWLPAKREEIHYELPSSTLALNIILNEHKVIDPSVASACLSSALKEARTQTQSSLVEGPFRHSAAPPNSEGQFGVVGGIYANKLTWGDVVAILQGLQACLTERECFMAMIIYLKDDKRGALGDAYIEPGPLDDERDKPLDNTGTE